MADHFIARLCELKFTDSAGSEAGSGAFEGYGAIFDVEDDYGDVILKGAFRQTLKEWKASKRMPPMLLQHAGWLGTAEDWVPVGAWEEMAEDDRGLYVQGRLLALDTDRGKMVYAAMKAGALDGLSIGYWAKEFTTGTKPGEAARSLKRVELREVSIVTFPANAEARIEAVKTGRDLTERDCERILREAGFSRDQAKTIVAKGYRVLQREADESAVMADVVAGLQAGTSILQE